MFSPFKIRNISNPGNKLENLPQRNIFFSGLPRIETDRNEIYVFNFPHISNSIQIKIQPNFENIAQRTQTIGSLTHVILLFCQI